MSEIFSKMVARYTELYMKAGVGLTIGIAKLMKPAMRTQTGDKQKPINDFEAQVLFDKLRKDSDNHKFSFGQWGQHNLEEMVPNFEAGKCSKDMKERIQNTFGSVNKEAGKEIVEDLLSQIQTVKKEYDLFNMLVPNKKDTEEFYQIFEQASSDPDFAVMKDDAWKEANRIQDQKVFEMIDQPVVISVKPVAKTKKTKSSTTKTAKPKTGKKKAAKKPTKKKSKK